MKKNKLKGMEVLLLGLLIVQFLCIAYSNLCFIDQNLDCDNAKLMKHITEMWNHKTLLIPQWSYTTTLEWDCTSVFAILLYGIVGDVYIACGLSNCLLTLIFIGALFYLFRGKELLYPLVCANLICVPYRVGMLDYYNMMFFAGTQYIVKVTVPILLIGILLAAEEGMDEKKKPQMHLWLVSFVYLGMLTLTSMSSGIYVTACGIAPVIMGYVCYKFFKWEKVPKYVWLLGAITLVVIIGSQKVNHYGMAGARGQSMILMNVYQFFGNLTGCFVGLFELFGGVTESMDTEILTLPGIMSVGKISLVVAILICGIRGLVKCIKKQGDLRTLMLVCVFLWNYFVLCVTFTRAGSATYEYRYHLIGAIPLLCVAGATFVTGMRTLKPVQQKCMFVVGFLALIFLNLVSYKSFFDRGEQNADLKEFVAYCDALDYDYVYMYNESDNGDICRLLGKDSVYMCLCDDGTVWAYGYYQCFNGSHLPSTNGIVAVSEDIDNFGEEMMFLDTYHLVKFDEVGNRSLYYFAEN